MLKATRCPRRFYQAIRPLTHSHFCISSSIKNKPNINSYSTAKNPKMLPGPLDEMLARNKKAAETHVPPPPLMAMVKNMRATKAGIVVLSCSDPRLNPYQILGVDGTTVKATMVRNAGGRAFDAIRSLAVLQTIGNPGTIVVMHHTDCGMTHFHNDAIRKALTQNAPNEASSIAASEFGEITGPPEESVLADLELIRKSPLILDSTKLIGLVYNVNTGLLSQVPDEKGEN